MLVSVLPDELIMVCLQVSNINLAAVDLLRVLFYENERWSSNPFMTVLVSLNINHKGSL